MVLFVHVPSHCFSFSFKVSVISLHGYFDFTFDRKHRGFNGLL